MPSLYSVVCPWAVLILKEAAIHFWDWVDNRAVVRRIVLLVTLYMTWRAFAWAAGFAELYLAAKVGGGLDVAAIIGAVTAPISVLQGFIFKSYTEGRG